MTHPPSSRQIEWSSVQREYRTGLSSLRAIAHRFGCSHEAIRKRARGERWQCDLRPKIDEVAREKVAKLTVDGVADRDTVEASAEMLARVRIGHRRDITKARAVTQALFDELAAFCETDSGISSLLRRSQVLKHLAEALRIQVHLEREAYGLNARDDASDLPLVFIRDYTGRRHECD